MLRKFLLYLCCSIILLSYQTISLAKVFPKFVPKKVVNHVIKIKTNDDFILSGQYYAGDESASGVIVLHSCKSSSKYYAPLAKQLKVQNMHVLMLDLRGYGDSVTKDFSYEKMKVEAVDIVSYQAGIAYLSAFWVEDLLKVTQFLQKKLAKGVEVSVIASGCSTAHAVSLAEKTHLNSLVLISPEMSFNDKENYKNLVDIPTYFINSSHQMETYKTAKELFAWSGSRRTKLQVFKGNAHDYQLISGQQYLVDDIVLWLKSNFSSPQQ